MTEPADDAVVPDSAAGGAAGGAAAGGAAGGGPAGGGAAAEEAARRRRLAEVFGDVLPEGSADEPRPSGRDDRWYEENRPPHHGG
ncbi:hypothetical protein AB0K14_04700 [Actinosynnema sp. NPDC050801]|uniref:hypothetical protein n=1 Tax=unclassified Actinosynnema TaxID=2637065 RepID=UPI0033CD1DEE